MKQILFVDAGRQFPEGVFRFLKQLQSLERVRTRGLFFKPVDYSALADINTPVGVAAFTRMETREKEKIAEHKELFVRYCDQQYISHDIHPNDDRWDRKLFAKETRFADLALISAELFYEDIDKRQPNSYLRDALQAAECPVVVVPENFEKISHLFMAYDGSKESLFAIKHFCYLFPQLLDLPTEMVYARREDGRELPEEEDLKRFARTKFDCLGYTKLHFAPAQYFPTWISEKKEVMLVSGSFSRSSLSYLGHRSFAEDLIHEHNLPVFIAHR